MTRAEAESALAEVLHGARQLPEGWFYQVRMRSGSFGRTMLAVDVRRPHLRRWSRLDSRGEVWVEYALDEQPNLSPADLVRGAYLRAVEPYEENDFIERLQPYCGRYAP